MDNIQRIIFLPNPPTENPAMPISLTVGNKYPFPDGKEVELLKIEVFICDIEKQPSAGMFVNTQNKTDILDRVVGRFAGNRSKTYFGKVGQIDCYEEGVSK